MYFNRLLTQGLPFTTKDTAGLIFVPEINIFPTTTQLTDPLHLCLHETIEKCN